MNAGGGTVYEQIAGLSLSVVTLFGVDTNKEIFAFVFSGHDTFTGSAADNYFVGGPGADVFTGAGGMDLVSRMQRQIPLPTSETTTTIPAMRSGTHLHANIFGR
jgi:hypothetical protein